jgi:hypothetical protein
MPQIYLLLTLFGGYIKTSDHSAEISPVLFDSRDFYPLRAKATKLYVPHDFKYSELEYTTIFKGIEAASAGVTKSASLGCGKHKSFLQC